MRASSTTKAGPGTSSPATAPNQVWLTDIERHEALLNLAVVKGHRWRPVAAGRRKLRTA